MQKKTDIQNKDKLKQVFEDQKDLELAILVGSQVKQNVNQYSDWDIAIRWTKQIAPIPRVVKTENLRRILAKQLELPESKIDLIDLTMAKLAMKANVAEDGIILKGEETLAWAHFLQKTWRELESFYWDKIYAIRPLSG